MTRIYRPVLSKADFSCRYAAGEFGNASPSWQNPSQFLDDYKYGRLYHLRNRQRAGESYYNLQPGPCYSSWMMKPNPEHWYVSEMAPTERTLFQGEVMQPVDGKKCLDLLFTTVRKPMRPALQEKAKRVDGLLAISWLRSMLCPNSYEWLQVLLDRYPGHVVEFSTYEIKWGTLPGFNTVFWEVRNY